MIKTKPATNHAEFDLWEGELRQDYSGSAAREWAFIDRLTDGKARFEKVLFEAAIKGIGISRGTAGNLVGLGKAFPATRRRVNISPSIHSEFRGLEETILVAALERAEEHRWTRELARMRMKAFKGGDVQALEVGWTPPPVKSKQQNAAETEAAGDGTEGGAGEDKSVFDSTAAGAAMSAEERREVLDGFADQKFASGNEFFDKIARTIEGKGDPRRFSRECDLKRLNPARARALAAFFAEIAEAAETAQRTVLNSQSGSAAPEVRPGGRERLGQANTSVDEVAAGVGTPEREVELPAQSSHLADEFEDENAEGGAGGAAEVQSGCPDQAPDGRPAESGSGEISASHAVTQTGSSSGTASSADDDLEIPAFLRRGHEDCAAEGKSLPPATAPEGPQGREGASADA